MNKNPLHLRVGADLLANRRAAAVSQMDMARQVGCSVPTIRLAESSGGILVNFAAMALHLGLILDGDGLPGGESLGASLRTLRQRRGISLRTLARTTAVSLPTLNSLEAGRDCRLANIAGVASSLGVVLRLRPATAPKAFYTSASKTSTHQAWTTPTSFLERLYPLVGGTFTLDPCSPTHHPAKAPVRATAYYTEEDDGLSLTWTGSVFMNPPYSRGIVDWVTKARMEVETGNATVVFGLVPARTETSWWHRNVASFADIWLLRGRMRFGAIGGGSAPFASALVVWGLNQASRAEVQKVFTASDAWYVPRSRADDP